MIALGIFWWEVVPWRIEREPDIVDRCFGSELALVAHGGFRLVHSEDARIKPPPALVDLLRQEEVDRMNQTLRVVHASVEASLRSGAPVSRNQRREEIR